LTIQNSTITGNLSNSTSNTQGSAGGGVSLVNVFRAPIAEVVTMQSTILSGNTTASTSAAFADLSAVTARATINLNNGVLGVTGGATLSASSANNLAPGTDLKLDPAGLKDNGGVVPTIALLSSSPALNVGSNPANLATDARGTGFLRTSGAGTDIGAFELQVAGGVAPTVTGTTLNGGSITSGQRSTVGSVTVTFSTIVSFAGTPSAAFQLQNSTGGGVTIGTVNNVTTTGVSVVTLTGFSGGNTVSGTTGSSLADGKYTLTVLANQVNNSGTPMASNFVLADSGTAGSGTQFYRLYGDNNGDRVTNGADLTPFTAVFGGASTVFDANFDGVVNGADLTVFIANFGKSI
jgi:hypothetical protein